MEDQNNLNTQSKTSVEGTKNVKLNLKSKLGILFFNLSIICLVVVGITLMSPILTLLYYCILIIVMLLVIIITLGLIFVAAPNVVPGIWNAITKGGVFLEKISSVLISCLPYFLGVCVGLSALALLMFLINKKTHKHSVRIPFSIVFMIIAIIGLIIVLIK